MKGPEGSLTFLYHISYLPEEEDIPILHSSGKEIQVLLVFTSCE